MKITRLRTQVVHLPIDPPIVTAILGSIRSADCVLTFLDTDEGLTGEGLVFSINNRRLSVIHDMVRQLEDLIVGLDPRMGGTLNARAWKELNFLGYEGVSIVGLAAVDNALWDLRGKAAGLNVAHLLGACRTAVPTYASGGLWLGSSIDELRREARSFVDRGFRAMKTRVGPTDPERMVARVAAVREAIGPDVALMVDANQQMSVKQAIRIGRMMEKLNLTWFEEPVICSRSRGRGGNPSGPRYADCLRGNGLYPSRNPDDAASRVMRRHDAGFATDGRPDGVPEGRTSVRGVPYSMFVASVSGNEPRPAGVSTRRFVAGAHAVVRENLSRAHRTRRQWRRDRAGPAGLGIQLRSRCDAAFRRLITAVPPRC